MCTWPLVWGAENALGIEKYAFSLVPSGVSVRVTELNTSLGYLILWLLPCGTQWHRNQKFTVIPLGSHRVGALGFYSRSWVWSPRLCWFLCQAGSKEQALGDAIGAVSTGEHQGRLGGPNRSSTSSVADTEIELKEGGVFIWAVKPSRVIYTTTRQNSHHMFTGPQGVQHGERSQE